MEQTQVRTIRDRSKGRVEVHVYPRPYTGRTTSDIEFHLHWEECAALFVFGITEMAYASVWRDWPAEARSFALRRLGMGHLSTQVLPTLNGGDHDEFILDTSHQAYFEAVSLESGVLTFSDHPPEVVDAAVRDDILFALRESGAVRDRRVELRHFPVALLSGFWTDDEIERNVVDMESEGLLGVQFLHGRVQDGVPQRAIAALGLTRDGERLAARVSPLRDSLFEPVEPSSQDQVHSATNTDHAGHVAPASSEEEGHDSATGPPAVFISYSHDTSQHKRWVAGLAAELRRNGIDVILDQWDLRLGGDLPKFMEDGVRRADRVLVVCTPDYVRKVNAGEGGAGYEGMLITGELVRDLGTTKFIPAIRRSAGECVAPTCLATKRYVDFRSDSAFSESLEELVRELHDEPRSAKPPLGANPFGMSAQAGLAWQTASEAVEEGPLEPRSQPLTADQSELLSCIRENEGVVAVSRTLSGIGLCFVGGHEEPRIVHGTFGSMGGLQGREFIGVKWDVVLRELEELGLVREYYEDVYVLSSGDIGSLV